MQSYGLYEYLAQTANSDLHNGVTTVAAAAAATTTTTTKGQSDRHLLPVPCILAIMEGAASARTPVIWVTSGGCEEVAICRRASLKSEVAGSSLSTNDETRSGPNSRAGWCGMMLEIIPCPLISANAEVYVGIGCCNTLTLVDLQITFPSRTPVRYFKCRTQNAEIQFSGSHNLLSCCSFDVIIVDRTIYIPKLQLTR